MRLNRRDWLRLTALGVTGHSLSGWLPALADDAPVLSGKTRSVILLWMPGGPSQIDTFDMQPGHANAGEFKPIDTSVPGVQICEHLPKLAQQMKDMAIVSSMQTKEGDHLRATYHLHTGYLPQPPVQYPAFGSLVSHELADAQLDLPGFVSITPNTFFNQGLGAGFLGPSRAPLVVGSDNNMQVQPQAGGGDYGPPLKVRDITLSQGIAQPQADKRIDLLTAMEDSFTDSRPALATNSHREAYKQAVRMMHSPAIKAFDLDEEPAALREQYGRNRFGQSCLLARRLVEQRVPFIEIGLSTVAGQQVFGWDTHNNNFTTVKAFCDVLDPGWSTLIEDLRQRGLLDSTMIVWMGEFGRTPRINGSGGRDHFPNAWSTVLCGGGIRGGQRYGKTEVGGESIAEKPVSVPQFFATICKPLGINPTKQNMSNVGRPIRIVEPGAKPIDDLLASAGPVEEAGSQT